MILFVVKGDGLMVLLYSNPPHQYSLPYSCNIGRCGPILLSYLLTGREMIPLTSQAYSTKRIIYPSVWLC